MAGAGLRIADHVVAGDAGRFGVGRARHVDGRVGRAIVEEAVEVAAGVLIDADDMVAGDALRDSGDRAGTPAFGGSFDCPASSEPLQAKCTHVFAPRSTRRADRVFCIRLHSRR